MSKVAPTQRIPLRLRVAVAALIGIGAVGAMPTMAHHAFAAEYDSEKPIDVTGTVTKAKWVNPHSRLFVDVINADGTITSWGFEFGAPNALEGRGLTKADLKPGARVHIKGYRSKNGGPFGYSVTLILADGRSFQTGGAPDSPPPGAGAGGNGQNAAPSAAP
jgi:hypothetical protein